MCYLFPHIRISNRVKAICVIINNCLIEGKFKFYRVDANIFRHQPAYFPNKSIINVEHQERTSTQNVLMCFFAKVNIVWQCVRLS